MRNDLAEMGEDVFVKRTQYEEARATIIKDKEERGKTIGDLQTNLNNQGDELEELKRQIRKKDMEMTEERMIRTNVANNTTFGVPLSSWGSRDDGGCRGRNWTTDRTARTKERTRRQCHRRMPTRGNDEQWREEEQFAGSAG